MNLFPRSVRIAHIQNETPLVTSFTFEYPERARPGQFVNIWIAGVDEKPMSVAYDDGTSITVSVAAVGTLTKVLAEKKVGDIIGVRGPFGQVFSWKPKTHIAMLAGGYGVAPLYFAASQAIKDGCTVDFFHGARSKDHLPLADRIKKLKGVTYYPATDDGSRGFTGTSVAAWMAHMDLKESKKYDLVMTCGPERMMKAVFDIAEKSNMQAQVSVERYMKCGFGVCGNCVVDDIGITTCKRGTVMTNEVVRNIKEFGEYHRDNVGKKHNY